TIETSPRIIVTPTVFNKISGLSATFATSKLNQLRSFAFAIGEQGSIYTLSVTVVKTDSERCYCPFQRGPRSVSKLHLNPGLFIGLRRQPFRIGIAIGDAQNGLLIVKLEFLQDG